VWCFLCGTGWILKYYLDELRLQRVKYEENVHKILAGKPEDTVWECHGCRWEDNIKTYHKEIGSKVVDWIRLAQVKVKWWVLMSAVPGLQKRR
jgi:hypothetical protein